MDDTAPASAAKDDLDRWFGFDLPATLVRLFQTVVDPQTGAIDQRASLRFLNATGLTWTNTRFAGTPPELFAFGQIDMDSAVYGCVLHDLKLSKDAPIATFSLSDGKGAYLGPDTRRGLGALLGVWLASLKLDRQRTDEAERVIDDLGFDANELPQEPPLGVGLRIPPGWRYAISADGLGVVARTEQFAPDQDFHADPDSLEPDDASESVNLADDAMLANHPATALWILRNAYAYSELNQTEQLLRKPLQRAYLALGRPGLAGRMETGVAED
jgi:hypothetical protein